MTLLNLIDFKVRNCTEDCGWEDCGWEDCGWEDCGWEDCGWDDCGWEAVVFSPILLPLALMVAIYELTSGRRRLRADLDNKLLEILEEQGETRIYDLWQQVEKELGRRLVFISPYYTLDHLEEKGLVTHRDEEVGDGKRIRYCRLAENGTKKPSERARISILEILRGYLGRFAPKPA